MRTMTTLYRRVGPTAVRRPRMMTLFSFALLTLVLSVAFTPPAWADGGEETDEGYVMVQSALSFLLNDSGPTGQEQAIVMIDDALAAADQDGVNVGVLQEARAAVESGNLEQGQQLLQQSISEAVAGLEPAVGEETGTGEVLPPLAGQGDVVGFDWLFLAASALALLVGVVLSYRFRPAENLSELRRDVLAAQSSTTAGATASVEGGKQR